ncbi:MAG TPA: DNA topology modulation protein [Pyrinomonadaceae bacterium]|nr:DNA topology modulation protein [Pyrinomonadaceae bacterium]
MKRVLVIGPGGSGKSTFARRLGEILGIEVKHLDSFYWRAGWTKPSNENWLKKVDELISGESWIIDGNFGGTLARRVERCDTIIFLDMPRLLCVWRVTKRRLTYRNRSRPDMAEGCAEKLDFEFISWVWNYSNRSRPKVVKLINENKASKKIVWLRSNADVEKFLNQLNPAKS